MAWLNRDWGELPGIFWYLVHWYDLKIFSMILSTFASSLIKQLPLIGSTWNIFAVKFPLTGYNFPERKKGRRSRWEEARGGGGGGGTGREVRPGLWEASCRQQPVCRGRGAGRGINKQELRRRRGEAPALQLPSRPPTHLPTCSSFTSLYTFFSSFPCSFSSADPSRHLLWRREVSRCEAPSASHKKMVSRNPEILLSYQISKCCPFVHKICNCL